MLWPTVLHTRYKNNHTLAYCLPYMVQVLRPGVVLYSPRTIPSAQWQLMAPTHITPLLCPEVVFLSVSSLYLDPGQQLIFKIFEKYLRFSESNFTFPDERKCILVKQLNIRKVGKRTAKNGYRGENNSFQI